MLKLTQYIFGIYPKWCGWLTKIIYKGSNVKFGKNFNCDSIPKITIDNSARLEFGDNVQLRRSVEFRIHGQSKIKLSDSCRIDRGVRLLAANNAEINLAEGVRVGLYTVFNGGDSIFVGKKTLISGFVYLQTSMHNYKGEGNIQQQGYSHAPIALGDDCWIGTHAVLFPGIILGNGVVVGSNAVVNKSYEKGCVIGGIPAKLITTRE